VKNLFIKSSFYLLFGTLLFSCGGGETKNVSSDNVNGSQESVVEITKTAQFSLEKEKTSKTNLLTEEILKRKALPPFLLL